MYTIGEFSKLCGVSVEALRYWENISLIHPVSVNEQSGYRFYEAGQLREVQRIKMLQSVGFKNKDIVKLLYEKFPNELFVERKNEILESIKGKKRELNNINFCLEKYKNTYSIVLKSIPKLYCVFSKKLFKNLSGISEEYKSLLDYIKKNKYKSSEPLNTIANFYDNDFKLTNISAECLLKVDNAEKLEDKNIKVVSEIPLAATVIHIGDYESLRKAYIYVYEWVARNGYVVCGKAREWYISGPLNSTGLKEDYVTELQIPIKLK